MSAVALPARRFRLSQRQRGTLWRGLAMLLYVLVTCFPFYWMFVTAFKRNPDLYELKNNPLLFNQPPTLEHVDYLFTRTLFGTWMWNSYENGTVPG